VEAINADVNSRQSGITPVRHVAFQTIAVGRDRNLTDSVVFPYRGNNVDKVATQRRLTTCQTHFFSTQTGEGTRNPTNFIDGQKAFIGDAARLVAIRQAVGATKVTHIGNRQAQVVKLTRKSISQL